MVDVYSFYLTPSLVLILFFALFLTVFDGVSDSLVPSSLFLPFCSIPLSFFSPLYPFPSFFYFVAAPTKRTCPKFSLVSGIPWFVRLFLMFFVFILVSNKVTASVFKLLFFLCLREFSFSMKYGSAVDCRSITDLSCNRDYVFPVFFFFFPV